MGKDSKPAERKFAIVRLVSDPAGTVTAHISLLLTMRFSIEGEKPACLKLAACVFALTSRLKRPVCNLATPVCAGAIVCAGAV